MGVLVLGDIWRDEPLSYWVDVSGDGKECRREWEHRARSMGKDLVERLETSARGKKKEGNGPGGWHEHGCYQ